MDGLSSRSSHSKQLGEEAAVIERSIGAIDMTRVSISAVSSLSETSMPFSCPTSIGMQLTCGRYWTDPLGTRS